MNSQHFNPNYETRRLRKAKAGFPIKAFGNDDGRFSEIKKCSDRTFSLSRNVKDNVIPAELHPAGI